MVAMKLSRGLIYDDQNDVIYPSPAGTAVDESLWMGDDDEKMRALCACPKQGLHFLGDLQYIR